MAPTLYALPSLRSRRTTAFLSQDELAKSAGLSRSTVIDIEMGWVKARLSTVRKLAEALHCAPADLVGEAARD